MKKPTTKDRILEVLSRSPGHWFPSDVLVVRLHVSTETCNRWLTELNEQGLIICRDGRSSFCTNEYKLAEPKKSEE